MTEEEAMILNHHNRQEYIKELRYLKTRQGGFQSTFLHLDHPLLMGNGPLLESSDEGKGAETIRSACEEVPLWRTLWKQARSHLTKKQRAILDALLVEFRTGAAASLSGQNRKAIERFKKNIFKKYFTQCFQAWERSFA